MRRPLAVLASLAAAAVPLAGAVIARPVTAAPVTTAGVPVFDHPVTVDAQRLAGEPDITIGSDDREYVSAPWGTQTATSFMWRSENGGATFRQMQAEPGFQNPYPSRAGGDTEIQTSVPHHPGMPSRLYFVDQNQLDSNTCGYSDDAGRSFTFTTGAVCPTAVGADRQWMSVTSVDPAQPGAGGRLDHEIQYIWYDHVGTGLQLARSDDGESYTTGPVLNSGPDSTGNPGNTVADPRTGVVYVVVDTTNGNNHGVAVSYSADGGKTLHNAVDAVPPIYSGSTGTDFAVIAIDSAGNLYATWAVQNTGGSWQTFVAHSTGSTLIDNGVRKVRVAGATAAQWSKPIALDGPGSARRDINFSVFPWIDAGDPGRIVVAYYGTSEPIGYDPNTQSSSWSVYMAQSLDALDAQPVFTTVRVSEAATHLSSICFNGVGCTGNGNRNLLDFFEVRHDRDGAAVVVYDDDANTLTAAFPGGPFVMVAHQVGGPSLFTGRTLRGSPSPATSWVDNAPGGGMLPTSDSDISSLDLLGAGATLSGDTMTVRFKVASLANAALSLPPTEPGVSIDYVLTWKWHDDLYYAAAHLITATGLWTYDAGVPISVPFTLTGGPKYVVYAINPGASMVGGSVDVGSGMITLTIPVSAVGAITSGERMLQATAFTLVTRPPVGALGPLADQADETPSFDDVLGVSQAVSSTPPPAPAPTPAAPGQPAPTPSPQPRPPALPNTSSSGAAPTIPALIALVSFAVVVRRRSR